MRRGPGLPCPPWMYHPEEPPQVLSSGSYPDPSFGFFTKGIASALLTGQESVTESNRPLGETQGGPSAQILDSRWSIPPPPPGRGRTSSGMEVL